MAWTKPENLGGLLTQMTPITDPSQRVEYLRAWRRWDSEDNGNAEDNIPIQTIGSNLHYIVGECGLPEDWFNAYIKAFPVYRASEEEKSLPVTSKDNWGRDIVDVCQTMLANANSKGEQQRADFNGKRIVANPGMTLDDVVGQYAIAINENCAASYAEKRAEKRMRDAAPDLLAALKWLHGVSLNAGRYINMQEDGATELVVAMFDARDAARAAIAKSRGEDND